MATLTISLSDEELQRLELLGKHTGLTVEQLVRLSISILSNQPDEALHIASKHVMEKTPSSIAVFRSPIHKQTVTPRSAASARRFGGIA